MNAENPNPAARRLSRGSRVLDLGIVISMLFAGAAIGGNWFAVYGPPICRPSIACDEPSRDFGELSASEPVDHTFVIRNVGGRPLTISLATTDCRCTRTSPAKFPQVVPPRGSLPISAELDLAGVEGAVEKHLFLTSDDRRAPRLMLTMRGFVRPAPSVPLTPVPEPALSSP